MERQHKIQKQITEIQKWLREEKIPYFRNDRGTILKYLRGCNYHTETVKVKLKNFYEIRSTSPELFKQRDPLLKNLETLFRVGVFFPLPFKPSDGRRLVIVKAGANDPSEIPMTDVFKAGIMATDLLMEIDDTLTSRGVGVIIDMTGIGFRHAIQMTPRLVWKMAKLWQDCYPIPIQGMDFINSPTNVSFVLNLFRRFLNEDLKSKFRVHKEHKTFAEVYDSQVIPTEYGGSLSCSSSFASIWEKQIRSRREWFLRDH